MTDDPLYGERPKPPLVPMSGEQAMGFDLVRAEPMKRRWPYVLTLMLLVAMLVLLLR